MIERSDPQPWQLFKCVLPQHTDHAGVMWHGAYLSWLEEARIEALHQVGLSYSELSVQGFEMPVVSLEIKYLSSLLHGEKVVLETHSLPRKRAHWPWLTKFLRDGEVVSEAKVNLVLIRKVGQEHHLIRKVPDFISHSLLKLQSGPVKQI